MNPKELDLSVVIVNWNVGQLLVEALRSLKASLEGIEAESIVVDNGSIDGSVQLVEREFPDVRVIANEENIGVSKARNIAIKASKGRCVMFLDADTVVFPDTVQKLLAFMDNTPDAGIAGCKQTYADGEWQSTCHRMITLKRETIVALGLSKLFPKLVDYGDLPLKAPEPFRVDWVGLACMIVRRNLLDEIGLLDENIFHHGDDVDLCQSIRNLGYSVYYLPGASLIHHRGQSAVTASELPTSTGYSRVRLQFAGRKYVIRKHYGNLSANIYHGLIIVEAVRKLLQDSLKSLMPQPSSSTHALTATHSDYMAVLRAALKGQI